MGRYRGGDYYLWLLISSGHLGISRFASGLSICELPCQLVFRLEDRVRLPIPHICYGSPLLAMLEFLGAVTCM